MLVERPTAPFILVVLLESVLFNPDAPAPPPPAPLALVPLLAPVEPPELPSD